MFSPTTNVQRDAARRLDQGPLYRRRDLGRQSAADTRSRSSSTTSSTRPRSRPSRSPSIGSGGDGTFGNGNDVDLQPGGRLSYFEREPRELLTINTAGLNLPTDEYELVL